MIKLVALGEPVHAVHKRIFNVGMWWRRVVDFPRKRYFEGKNMPRKSSSYVSQAIHDEISKQTRSATSSSSRSGASWTTRWLFRTMVSQGRT